MSSLSSRRSTTTLKNKFVNVKTLSYLFTTVCGGCKVGFKHPLHYRLHCTIFHDPHCPMKVRKIYCTDIVKPTSIKHEGKEAYQCQYYKMVTTTPGFSFCTLSGILTKKIFRKIEFLVNSLSFFQGFP